ncbi:MAG: sel1 repeat family protein [Rhodospirillaceae bacterium]|jgi:TPR repeat protein|nr:sel1 repeat family protein [Rhodospirillaceae bacterium]
MVFRIAMLLGLFTTLHTVSAADEAKSANPYSPGADLAVAIEAYDGGDIGVAMAAWRRAAKAGSVDAMTSLANIFHHGESVRQDLPRAEAWYRRAAELGDTVAQMNLGDLMASGHGTARDVAGAYFWLSLAGRGGNAWAHKQARMVAKRLTPGEVSVLNTRLARWQPSRP